MFFCSFAIRILSYAYQTTKNAVQLKCVFLEIYRNGTGLTNAKKEKVDSFYNSSFYFVSIYAAFSDWTYYSIETCDFLYLLFTFEIKFSYSVLGCTFRLGIWLK